MTEMIKKILGLKKEKILYENIFSSLSNTYPFDRHCLNESYIYWKGMKKQAQIGGSDNWVENEFYWWIYRLNLFIIDVFLILFLPPSINVVNIIAAAATF